MNAGIDQRIDEGSAVTLAGTVSDEDPEDGLKYSWSHNSTLSITLAGGDTATTTFTAPNVSEETTIEFTLTVNDGTVDVSDSVTITVADSANRPPSVNAGIDQRIDEGSAVTLAGTVSDEDPEDGLKYSWSHNSTLSITLAGGDTATTTFTAPNVSEETTIEFTLTVNDGTVDVSDSVTITVADSANRPPSVNAGIDQRIDEGSAVTLAGTVSDEDPEDGLKYSWSHDSTLFIPFDDSTLTPSFTAPNVSEETTIEFTLTVNDGTVDVSDSVTITVADSANRPPSVNAGIDQRIDEGSAVTLAGTVSDEDPEDGLKYSWSHDSTLFIPFDDSTLTPSFTAPNVSEETTIEFHPDRQ